MSPDELLNLCRDLDIDKVKNVRGQITGLCPFHGETRPSWGMSGIKDKHPFNCYGCHQKGTLATLVMRLKGYTVKQAMAYIRLFGAYDDIDAVADGEAATSILRYLENPKTVMEQPVPDYLFAPYTGKAGKLYLATRGLRMSTWEYSSFREPGYDPEQERILYPWHDSGGFWGCTGHYIGKSEKIKREARSLPYFGLKKGSHLFSPWYAHSLYRRGVLVVVEGEFDSYKVAVALRDHQLQYPVLGIGNSLATENQMKKIIAYGMPILPFFDDDEPGHHGRAELTKFCSDAVPVHSEYKYPKRKEKGKRLDPGGLTSAEIITIINCAKPKPLL